MPDTPVETSVTEHELRVAARPETVFAYFTDPVKMVQWMGVDATLDPRPGGVCRIAFSPSDAHLEYVVDAFGGGPEERREAFRTGSPLTYVDDVRAPLLIIQGRNDTRTPARPAARYVERLQERGHPVEIDWFDAGHMGGASDDELAVAQMAGMLEFARRVVAEDGSA